MSVDLTSLPEDEEWLRLLAAGNRDMAPSIQNVLDALNYYRCAAKSNEHELTRMHARAARLEEELSLCRSTLRAHNDLLNRRSAECPSCGVGVRAFGSNYGLVK